MYKGWTDVVCGKLSLQQVKDEIAFQVIHRSPKRIIVDIKLREDFEDKKLNGYHTKIWISNKDFARWK